MTGYNYTVIRTKRKTLSLSVSSDNTITVRCPYNISERKIEEFINSKRLWLDKIVSENQFKLSNFKGVSEYREILVGGLKLPLIISDRNEIMESAVYVKSLDKVKELFISRFSEKFIDRVGAVSAETGLEVSSVGIRYYKSRWGCCDSKGRIKFNYLLFMLPYELQRYVIIHELCHTVYFNHSQKFWGLVYKFEPHYRELRKQLKSYNFIINLY